MMDKSSRHDRFGVKLASHGISNLGSFLLILRNNSYLLMIAGYVVMLLMAYAAYGVLFQFSLGMYALLALPLILIVGRHRLAFIKSWVPFLVTILSYEALQGVVGALATAGGIFSLYAMDTAIWGFNMTGTIQTALQSQPMTIVMTLLYTLHLPLVVFASFYFWRSRNGIYKRYVYAIVLTSYCALLTFLLIPTAPPWYEGTARDLLQGVDSTIPVKVYADLMNLIESDKFAAFPSLHTAYAIIFLYYMKERGSLYGLAALPVTAGILLSTLYLGQHYVIDLIGGTAYALVSCLLVDRTSVVHMTQGHPRSTSTCFLIHR